MTASSTRPRSAASPPPATLDVTRLRREFPVLRGRVHGKPLVYLDNGATSQKPRTVVEAEADFSLLENANVHRGVHALSQRATALYDQARDEVREFLGAGSPEEIIFTSGTTAAINLVAQSFARPRLKPGDEIVLTEMEHHSNIVPWQLVARETGARIRVIPVSDTGDLVLTGLGELLTERTRIVGVAHVSNVLGTLNPVRRIADAAHAVGAIVVVDGAQAVPHLQVDVQQLGADFYALSAHKMFGPTGVGVLYGRAPLLEAMPPWQGGGGMIQNVTFEETTFAPIPARFEAGTPPIAQAIGMGAAVRWMRSLEWSAVEAHEASLVRYATERLAGIPGVRLIGTSRDRVGVVSFVVEGVHPHDVGTVLDLQGIAVRASHHCAQPLMRRFGVSGTVRASFALYNTRAEVDALLLGLEEVRRVFA
jgi:cysteine desulfurase / selenocysteine lyase